MGKYKSLFDVAASEFTEGRNVSFRKKVSEVLEDVVGSGSKVSEKSSAVDFIVASNGLVRGALDYKITEKMGPEGVYFIKSTSNAAMNLYQNPAAAAGIVFDYRSLLKQQRLEGFLDFSYDQEGDSFSWKASNPAYSAKLVKELDGFYKGKDILFLAIGGGGIAAGMDVFLRYKDVSGSKGSVFYPVRFSRDKKMDDSPQISCWEDFYLERWGETMPAVVFDEDSVSGRTLGRTRDRFFGVFAKPISLATNVRGVLLRNGKSLKVPGHLLHYDTDWETV